MKLVSHQLIHSWTHAQTIFLAEVVDDTDVDEKADHQALAARCDWLEKELRVHRQDVQEVKAAQVSLAGNSHQETVRILEHQSLIVVEIAWMLHGAGIGTQINLEGRSYLGCCS